MPWGVEDEDEDESEDEDEIWLRLRRSGLSAVNAPRCGLQDPTQVADDGNDDEHAEIHF